MQNDVLYTFKLMNLPTLTWTVFIVYKDTNTLLVVR